MGSACLEAFPVDYVRPHFHVLIVRDPDVGESVEVSEDGAPRPHRELPVRGVHDLDPPGFTGINKRTQLLVQSRVQAR